MTTVCLIAGDLNVNGKYYTQIIVLSVLAMHFCADLKWRKRKFVESRSELSNCLKKAVFKNTF